MANPVNLAAPEIEASRLLREIDTPEALAAIDELIEAGNTGISMPQTEIG